MFQLRAGIVLINEGGPLTKKELAEALQERRSVEASDNPTKGADQIIAQLRDSHLITETKNGYRLSTRSELAEAIENTVLLYAGEEVPGAGDERAQADRILANMMYENPMLISISKFVYRNAPVEKFEVKRELIDTRFLDDKLNDFTIDMGLNLLTDSGVIKTSSSSLTRGRWPIRLFAHVVYEEYFDLGGEKGSGVREPDLFERLQTLYGIKHKTFNRLLSRLHNAGVVSEASYEELLLNLKTLEGANIHE
ncbi:hypothetical protein [Halalkalicoccus salilacus]|uniref:hypothetical protein n=1 Tax=Halalkalicoccus salilacus TaxID=3117459 RepID=UPI00300E8C63